jgi:hypothetical protein
MKLSRMRVYARFLPELEALRPEEVIPVNLDGGDSS